MPGSSLWLVPPASHPLHSLLTELIHNTVPSLFPTITPPQFSPHVTLTSGIPPSRYGSDPQSWLESFEFPPASDVTIEFKGLATEEPFFRKCNIWVDGKLESLATEARQKGVLVDSSKDAVFSWFHEKYRPHCSLIYADIEIAEKKRQEVERVIKEKGIRFDGGIRGSGWTGGQVWLVPTDKSIEEWKPIAVRDLK